MAILLYQMQKTHPQIKAFFSCHVEHVSTTILLLKVSTLLLQKLNEQNNVQAYITRRLQNQHQVQSFMIFQIHIRDLKNARRNEVFLKHLKNEKCVLELSSVLFKMLICHCDMKCLEIIKITKQPLQFQETLYQMQVCYNQIEDQRKISRPLLTNHCLNLGWSFCLPLVQFCALPSKIPES